MVRQRCFGSLARACQEFGVATAFWVPGHGDFRNWVTRKKLEVGIPGNPAYSAGGISAPCLFNLAIVLPAFGLFMRCNTGVPYCTLRGLKVAGILQVLSL